MPTRLDAAWQRIVILGGTRHKGTVDGDVDYPGGFHQFAGSKAPWYEISDDLPQHEGWPDEAMEIK